jgi:hypothetical protein
MPPLAVSVSLIGLEKATHTVSTAYASYLTAFFNVGWRGPSGKKFYKGNTLSNLPCLCLYY